MKSILKAIKKPILGQGRLLEAVYMLFLAIMPIYAKNELSIRYASGPYYQISCLIGPDAETLGDYAELCDIGSDIDFMLSECAHERLVPPALGRVENGASGMSEYEALQIFGLNSVSDFNDSTYRNYVKQHRANHPDKSGGDDEQMKKVNEAKMLLENKSSGDSEQKTISDAVAPCGTDLLWSAGISACSRVAAYFARIRALEMFGIKAIDHFIIGTERKIDLDGVLHKQCCLAILDTYGKTLVSGMIPSNGSYVVDIDPYGRVLFSLAEVPQAVSVGQLPEHAVQEEPMPVLKKEQKSESEQQGSAVSSKTKPAPKERRTRSRRKSS